jgi:hypothetical protein
MKIADQGGNPLPMDFDEARARLARDPKSAVTETEHPNPTPSNRAWSLREDVSE